MTDILCKKRDDIVAYLQNELDEKSKISFEQHLTGCTDCSKRLNDYCQITQKLKSVPKDAARENIPEKVLQAISLEHAAKPIRLARWAAILRYPIATEWRRIVAAGILLLLGAGILIFNQSREIKPVITNTPANSETITRALDWLAANQDETGKWSVEKWGGDKQYEIALTGLSIMALSGAEPGLRNRYAASIDKGINYLINRQSADGSFGPHFTGTPYNHGIATVCLLENLALNNDKKLKIPLKSAINYITWMQKADGGWGYLASEAELPNTAVSFWSIHALLLANSMDFGDLTAPIKKGFEWLSGISDESGRPGYSKTSDFPYGAETLSAMTAFCYTYGGEKYLPDKEKYRKLFNYLSVETTSSNEVNYYRSYFMSYIQHPSMDAWRDNLFATLSKTQRRTDILAGSWDPSDKWGEVGGRIYTTALASLSLEATIRGERLKNQFSTR
jgi:prenyltransferase beta subunit